MKKKIQGQVLLKERLGLNPEDNFENISDLFGGNENFNECRTLN